MKPIPFEGQMLIVAKDQPQYLPLPAHISPDGRITCCWSLSWRERIRVLFTGVIWHQIQTFNTPLQPQKLTVEKPLLKNYE